MAAAKNIQPTAREKLDLLFRDRGYIDYKWIDPQKIIISQWVRMKCMYGCGEYGQNACCPPNLPSVSECERFFHEYRDAVIFRFEKTVDKPEAMAMDVYSTVKQFGFPIAVRTDTSQEMNRYAFLKIR